MHHLGMGRARAHRACSVGIRRGTARQRSPTARDARGTASSHRRGTPARTPGLSAHTGHRTNVQPLKANAVRVHVHGRVRDGDGLGRASASPRRCAPALSGPARTHARSGQAWAWMTWPDRWEKTPFAFLGSVSCGGRSDRPHSSAQRGRVPTIPHSRSRDPRRVRGRPCLYEQLQQVRCGRPQPDRRVMPDHKLALVRRSCIGHVLAA